MSKLLSSSGSASKNSNTFNYSNNTLTKQSPNVGTCGNNTSSSNSKKGGISSSSIESKKIKKSIITKRKIIYDKLMKKNKQNDHQIPLQTDQQSQIDENELKDVMNECEYSSTDINNKSTNHNVKITNITNIILNVKNYGKSFDVQRLTNGPNAKDKMMKDIKSLHLITQKALTSKNKVNPVDSFDDERTSFFNFRNSLNNQKEFYISDNSGINIRKNEKINLNKTNEANTSKQSSIINIININNNYSIDKTPSIANKQQIKKQQQLYMHTEPPAESFRSSKAKIIKAIPKSNNIKGLPVKDFISAISTDQKNKKGKFISLSALKK